MNRRGFSMMEVLMAMVLLTVVVPGLVAMFLGSKRSQVGSYAVEQASQFAEGKIDSLRWMGRSFLKPAGSWSANESTSVGGKLATWRWKFDTTPGVAGRAGIVSVEVAWTQGRTPHAVVLQGAVQ